MGGEYIGANYNLAKTEADKIDAQIIETLKSGHSFRVEAGAGSGKTYSLNRVIEWIQTNKWSDYSRKKQNVVCITYTNAAVDVIAYKLFWDEFSSWLLEIVKPAYGQPVNGFIYSMVLSSFERLLELLHPFMPFITEELWQQLREREPGESLMVTQLFEPVGANEQFLAEFEVAKEIISNVRSIRLQKNIALKEELELQFVGTHPVEKLNPVIIKMCNLSSVTVVESKSEGASSFMIGTTEFAVPLGNMIDVEAEIARMEAELKHKEGFLQGVMKKLSNEKFVNNAPAAVLELERKKQADAESIINSLKESIAALKKS